MSACEYCQTNLRRAGPCADCQAIQDAATKPLHVRIETLERELAEAQAQVSRGQDAVNTLNDRLATLRQRHTAAVKSAFIEAMRLPMHLLQSGEDAAWLASEAKKGVST